jgi:DNA-binding beta-propeller fold protein YncE
VHPESGAVETALDGFRWPYRIRILEDRGVVVIPDLTLHVVRFVDYATHEEVGRIEVPDDGPQGITVTPDGGTLFLSLSAAGEVAVVDLETRRIVRRLEAGRTPDGIGWSPVVLGR